MHSMGKCHRLGKAWSIPQLSYLRNHSCWAAAFFVACYQSGRIPEVSPSQAIIYHLGASRVGPTNSIHMGYKYSGFALAYTVPTGYVYSSKQNFAQTLLKRNQVP